MSNGEVKLSTVDGKYDIDFGSDGDFITDDGLETAVLMSLLLDKRANAEEAPQPVRRSGYWGYEVNDMDFSKLWLLYGRLTTDLLNKSIEYANNCLQWLIDDGYATAINTESEFKKLTSDISTWGISMTVTITKVNDIILSENYLLWVNTDF